MKKSNELLDYNSLYPTKEQYRSMQREFELCLLTAALIRGYIPLSRYQELVEKRVGLKPPVSKTSN